MLDYQQTSRGFVRAGFNDRNGASCSIQESSLATQGCLWLGVDTSCQGAPAERMHLTQEMAAHLSDALAYFAVTGVLPSHEDEKQKEIRYAVENTDKPGLEEWLTSEREALSDWTDELENSRAGIQYGKFTIAIAEQELLKRQPPEKQ